MEEKIVKSDSVFISHIGEEAPVALKLKRLIQEALGTEVPVFVSSDYESIKSGDEWYGRIVESIKAAKVVIVLISPESVGRPWINFEAGVGVGSNGRVFPVAIRGFRLGDLRPPLQALHARDIHEPNSISAIIRDVGAAIQRNPSTFELSNTGNQDLELVEIEVFIPETLISQKALHNFDQNYIDITTPTIEGLRYYKMTYRIYEGSPHTYFGITEPLPRYFTTSMPPRVFKNFRTRIRTQLNERERSMVIRYQVYVRGFKTERNELTVGEFLNAEVVDAAKLG